MRGDMLFRENASELCNPWIYPPCNLFSFITRVLQHLNYFSSLPVVRLDYSEGVFFFFFFAVQKFVRMANLICMHAEAIKTRVLHYTNSIDSSKPMKTTHTLKCRRTYCEAKWCVYCCLVVGLSVFLHVWEHSQWCGALVAILCPLSVISNRRRPYRLSTTALTRLSPNTKRCVVSQWNLFHWVSIFIPVLPKVMCNSLWIRMVFFFIFLFF